MAAGKKQTVAPEAVNKEVEEAVNVARKGREVADPKFKRVPINGDRAILNVTGLDNENFHYCWINDNDDKWLGNIERFKNAGYEHVQVHEVGAIGSVHVNQGSDNIGNYVSRPVGAGVTAYLMRIPIEWFNEDCKAAEDKLQDTEALMYEQAASSKGSYGKVEVTR